MHDGAHGEQGHRVVKAIERVAARVEKEDVAQPQHQAWHGHWQHGQQFHQPAQALPGRATALGFLQQIRASKHQRGAKHRCAGCHLQAVDETCTHFGVDQTEPEVVETRCQVVGPQGDERGEHRHAQHRQNQEGDEAAIREHGAVVAPRRLGRVGHGAGREHRCLAAAHMVVHRKCQHCGQQQQDGHHRATGKVLLADHQFEDIGGQHIEIAANHLGDAEVGDDQGEGDQRGGNQAVFGPRQGDGEEFPRGAGAHGVCRFIQARVGQAQGRHENHHGVRKHGKTLGHHNAGRAVNLLDAQALHRAFEHALVAKPVDQRDRRQQRRRQERDQGDAAKQAFERHAGTRKRVGKTKSQRHRDRRHQRRHPQAVPQAFQQRGRAGVVDEVGEPDEIAVFALQRLQQDAQQRQRQKRYQKQSGQPNQSET